MGIDQETDLFLLNCLSSGINKNTLLFFFQKGESPMKQSLQVMPITLNNCTKSHGNSN